MLATIAVKSQFLGANREINIGHHRTLPSGLDCQIQRSAAAWRLRSEQTGSKVRIVRDLGGTGGRGIADRFCYADFPVTYLRVAQLDVEVWTSEKGL